MDSNSTNKFPGTSDPVKSAIAPLSNWADVLYRFTLIYSDYISKSHNYDFCDLSSMVELHTLTAISDNPGKSIKELAIMWNRTDGALSQTVSRLEKKGYVTRQKDSENAKYVRVYATPKGQTLSEMHKMYDSAEVSNTIRELCEKGCSTEEIAAFFKVATVYIELLK